MEKEKRQRNPEAFGIAGFTLGIVSFVMILVSPPIVGMLTALVGGILCYLQQKKHKTRTGKIGLILNVIGLFANAIWWFALLKYIYPLLQSKLGTQFPTA